ncbi:cysteine hydrolase family protein [Pseudonocardia acaciae]|uniref:cysteine hydrolase family protein n=1 Tax=Pseudonocardia acaciae TaxID=551276 RepID=UPI00068449FB|nr:isochorismatase family cysteine hydrolase [Pseudonocardia acaciae]
MSDAEPFIDPRVTALLVIDMQNGFCHPDSRMERSGVGVIHQRAIVPRVLELVALAHERRIPVLWSQQVHLPSDVTRRRRRIPSHQSKQRWTPCLRGSWEVDFIDEVRPHIHDQDFVVTKHRASMFFETTLDAELRMLGIEQVLVSGTTTAFCVETTIRDAYYRDFDVIAVEDAIADPRPAFHADTMAKVETFFGVVTTVAELPKLIVPGVSGAAEAPVLDDVLAEAQPA